MYVVLGILASWVLLFIVLRWWGQRTSNIEQTGTPGSAVVLSVFDDGLSSHGPPIVKFRCRVTPESGEPFEGETSPFVRRTVLASFYVGQTVAVRINPRKRKEFYIVDDSQLFYADAEHP